MMAMEPSLADQCGTEESYRGKAYKDKGFFQCRWREAAGWGSAGCIDQEVNSWSRVLGDIFNAKNHRPLALILHWEKIIMLAGA